MAGLIKRRDNAVFYLFSWIERYEYHLPDSLRRNGKPFSLPIFTNEHAVHIDLAKRGAAARPDRRRRE